MQVHVCIWWNACKWCSNNRCKCLFGFMNGCHDYNAYEAAAILWARARMPVSSTQDYFVFGNVSMQWSRLHRSSIRNLNPLDDGEKSPRRDPIGALVRPRSNR
jgi:hypothetical protein